MEPEYQTVSQMYDRMQVMMRQQKDTGVRLAAADSLLEPRNPFAAKTRRRPKPAVALIAFAIAVFAATFLFFSFHHRQ